MNIRSIGTFIFFILVSVVNAQDKSPIKFGKISPDDFKQQAPSFDTSANAVVISDVGTSRILPNNSGGFGYEFQRQLRVKILNKNGLDAGDFNIPVYISRNSEMKEELRALKAFTYNLEGGKIVETKLENSQVFTEKENRNYHMKKFALPALKEGSIFEISYTILSDFLFDFRPWQFQGDYPCLWSEYNVEIPEYYHYVTLTQGYLPFHINKSKETSRTFLIRPKTGLDANSRPFSIDGMVVMKTWVIKNVPSLKEEAFTTTINNHRSKIEFQLSAIVYPQSPIDYVMNSWPKVSEDMMKHENFGLQLSKFNGWLKDELENVIGNATDPHEKTKKIFEYVRDNYTCVSRGSIYTSTTLKSIFKQKSGTATDLNLLLTAMLEQAGIETYPVLLSTRRHGFTNEIYPLMDRFNYVVTAALVGDNDYLLDASIPELGFNMLDESCYNGHARVLTKDPPAIFLSSDSLLEKKVTMAFIVPENGQFNGYVKTQMGYYNSLRYRHAIKQSGETGIIDNLKKSLGPDFIVKDARFDSLTQLEKPIALHYNISLKADDPEIIYLNPIIGDGYKENPFKSATRLYPVEMPYRIDETYLLNLEIPQGYVVDEIPKSAKVSLNDSDGYFEYLVSYDKTRIQLRCRVLLNKTTFVQEDYEILRNFYGFIVNKQAEQIVLKKTAKP